jgi:hypothetical protein
MILGYGIAGPNEKYLEATLKEFQRLCDKVIIVSNDNNQHDLIKSYGFEIQEDNREWGKFQNRIKEDFLKRVIPKLKPDACICLDMDEVIDENFTKDNIYELIDRNVPAGYFHLINLWNDKDHYNPNLSFWNIRYWKPNFNYSLDVAPQPLHCGLFPKIYWTLGVRLPHIIKHYGLIEKEARDKKIRRYDKYDPKAQYKGKQYYDELASGYNGEVFDEHETKQKVVEYVSVYKQKPIGVMKEKKEEICYYVRNPHGVLVAIPERHLQETLKRKGFEFVGEATPQASAVKIEAPIIEVNPLECQICGFVGKSISGIKSHVRNKHA